MNFKLLKENNDWAKQAKIWIAILIVSFFCDKSFAQYKGGKGEGFAMAETAQLSFGIKQVSNENGFRFTPNPIASGQNVILQFDKPLHTNVELLVADLTGKIIRKETLTAGSNQYPLNTNGMKQGVYIIKITSPEYEGEKKMIIL